MGKRKYNGEGSCYYHKTKQCYIGQYTNPFTGKRHSVSDKDEKKCLKKLRNAIAEVEHGKYTESSNITIEQLGNEIVELKHKANILCSNSYGRYLETLKIIKEHIGDFIIKKITKSQIQNFLNELTTKYSNSVIDKVYCVLNQIFREALARDLILKNPMTFVIKPKSDKKDRKIRAFTIEEQKKFLIAIEGHKYQKIFLLALNTGMRCGEILALQPEDIDFEKRIIHVHNTLSQDENYKPIFKDSTKTYAGTRDIPFDDTVAIILKAAIHSMTLNPYRVIFSNQGKLLRTSTINSAFNRICKKAGIEVQKGNVYLTEHSLRHSFATRCIESGMPPHVLQKFLGHTDVSVTINDYTDIYDQYKKDEFNKYLEYKRANNF